MTAISQRFFHRLAFSANYGVRVQRHYELFEYKPEIPDYSQILKDITMLPDDGSGWQNDRSIPKRQGASGIWGWYFNAFFVETPTYGPKLYDLYRATGGTFIKGKIKNTEAFLDLNVDILINCSGRWATELFPEDKKNTKVIRGHMVDIGAHEVPHDHRDQYFSYNYSPDINIYSRNDKQHGKSHADVLFYPRSDGWLVGASRQEGYPEIGQPWRDEDEQIAVETIKLPGWDVEIPKPVWELNRELILNITDPAIDIANPKYKSTSLVGYRFGRDPLRIEAGESGNDKLLVHNYGHGGAGYTLSWGSAYEVLNIIRTQTGETPAAHQRNLSGGLEATPIAMLEDLVRGIQMKGSDKQ